MSPCWGVLEGKTKPLLIIAADPTDKNELYAECLVETEVWVSDLDRKKYSNS